MGASVDKLDADNLEFHECLGEGGYGFVRRVTFKSPYNGYSQAAGKTVAYGLGKKEVEIMSKLKHPHIVDLLGICDQAGAHLIVMEYTPNGSLHDYLKNHSKALSYQLQKKWATESAKAISYLHGHNFLHRDIKAQNCLLFHGNHLKLCDFGIAREIEESQTTSSQKGTYRYMAPEIHVGNMRGRAVYSQPSDVWAYGMLLLEICTRKPPFHDLEWHRVIFEVGSGTKPSIPEGCPQDFSYIMQQCWKSDPKTRPNIRTIAKELGACWRFKRLIHKGKQLQIQRAACCPKGNMVVLSFGKVYLLRVDGTLKKQLVPNGRVSSDDIDADSANICISSFGYIFVLNACRRFIHVFRREGSYLHKFKTDEFVSCLAGRDGQLLACDYTNIITIHACPDGSIVNQIKCSIGEGNAVTSMAVNSKNQILLTMTGKVDVIDYFGNLLFRFTPTMSTASGLMPCGMACNENDVKVKPCGITCDESDYIYIAVTKCVQSSGNTAGHVHVFTPTGEFVQCISQGLFKSCDFSLSLASDGSLVVTEDAIIRDDEQGYSMSRTVRIYSID